MVKIFALLSLLLLASCIEPQHSASKKVVDVVLPYTRIDMGPYWIYDFCYDGVRYLAMKDFLREKLDDSGRIVSCK